MEREPGKASPMPVWDHLAEMRVRLVRSLVGLFLASVLAYVLSDYLVVALEQPLLRILPASDRHLYFTGVTDKFVTYIKVSLLFGLLVAAPYLFWEIWRFLQPGLKQAEKRLVVPFVGLASLAFLCGVAFAFFLLLPVGFRWLIEFGSIDAKPIITLREYFAFTLKLLLCLGLVFEVPVLLMLLGRLGVLDRKKLLPYRKHAIVGNALFAALATPTNDVLSMLLVFGALLVLFELGLLGMWMGEYWNAGDAADSAAVS